MKKTLFTLVALIAMVSVVSAGSCGSGSHSHGQKAEATKASMEKKGMDIVETALAADNFTTLVAAVKAAGLVEALKGEGPFTVFAPTDEAFAELPEGTLEKLLKNPKQLSNILTYHVVEGAVTAEQVVKLDKAQTLNGQNIMIAASDDGVTVSGSGVIATDILCSNGVIHVLDKVMLPSMEK